MFGWLPDMQSAIANSFTIFFSLFLLKSRERKQKWRTGSVKTRKIIVAHEKTNEWCLVSFCHFCVCCVEFFGTLFLCFFYGKAPILYAILRLKHD